MRKERIALAVLIIACAAAIIFLLAKNTDSRKGGEIGASLGEADDAWLVRNTGDKSANIKVGDGITGFVIRDVEPGATVAVRKGNISVEASKNG